MLFRRRCIYTNKLSVDSNFYGTVYRKKSYTDEYKGWIKTLGSKINGTYN